jgi:putative flippase GtrA
MITGVPVSGWRSVSEGRRNVVLALVRYGVVGLCTNVVGYFLYLGVTLLGIGPKTSMSLLYAIGATMGFIGNRRWVFAHDGSAVASMLRYWIAHSIGYGINFAMLYGLVDVLGYSHRIVQAVAILVVAGCLFLMFHFFVFPQRGKTVVHSLT